MKIDGHLDLFSGIGGFSLGLKQAGIEPRWLGFSDIDKYANKLFKRRFPNAKELGSVTDVSYESLGGQRIDLLTGGFPCQAFSIAGKRKGFDDTRGTLFFEIQRVLEDYIRNEKPISCILLENVKGLLNHDNGRTFTTIYGILSNLNYTLECQLVNTKWWLPQNRERIFIFGRYNGNPSGRKVFPIYGDTKEISRIYAREISKDRLFTNTITARYEGQGTGSYVVENKPKGKLRQVGIIGNNNDQAHRVYSSNGISKTITDGGGLGAKTGLYKINVADFRSDEGLRVRKDVSPTLCARDYKDPKLVILHSTQAVETESRIRKLTPNECLRLQGFPDNWNDCCSDTQRYKQAGNAVSVPVIKSIVEKIYDL